MRFMFAIFCFANDAGLVIDWKGPRFITKIRFCKARQNLCSETSSADSFLMPNALNIDDASYVFSLYEHRSS